MSNNSLNRSYKTSLTDNEVIIFDALFDCSCLMYLLKRDIFQKVFYGCYSHKLNDSELIDVIKNLNYQGFLQIEGEDVNNISVLHLTSYIIDSKSIWISLTPKGGKLWELERNPKWNDYCSDKANDTILEVWSPCLETANLFFQTAQECGLYLLNGNRTYEQRQGDQLIPWKKFDSIYVISDSTKRDEQTSLCNWELYKKQRKWWRTINELLDM